MNKIIRLSIILLGHHTDNIILPISNINVNQILKNINDLKNNLHFDKINK